MHDPHWNPGEQINRRTNRYHRSSVDSDTELKKKIVEFDQIQWKPDERWNNVAEPTEASVCKQVVHLSVAKKDQMHSHNKQMQINK